MNDVTYTRTFTTELSSLPEDAMAGVGRALQALKTAGELHPRSLIKLKYAG